MSSSPAPGFRASLTSASPVTVITASQEDLGDLKLYRIPEPVTVAANSQKQVALMTRPGVRIALLYRQGSDARRGRAAADAGDAGADRAQPHRGRARPAAAGGKPGPVRRARGPAACCSAKASCATMPSARRSRSRSARFPASTARSPWCGEQDRWLHYRLTVTNDRAVPVSYQATFPEVPDSMRFGRRLGRRLGRPMWAVTIPANGSVTLDYRVRREPPPPAPRRPRT